MRKASNEVAVSLHRLGDSRGRYIMEEVTPGQFLALTLEDPAVSISCLFLSFSEKPVTYKRCDYPDTDMLCGSLSQPHGEAGWRGIGNPLMSQRSKPKHRIWE